MLQNARDIGTTEMRAVALAGRAPRLDLGSVNLHGVLLGSPNVPTSDFEVLGDSTACPERCGGEFLTSPGVEPGGRRSAPPSVQRPRPLGI